MSFKDHFSQLASLYATFRPTYPAELFDALARLCDAHDLAWDCACGSGQATGALADRFAKVLATDASAQQLAAAPARTNVTYQVAAAEHSPLGADTADLVTVAQALHWFDLEAFYDEVQRVLKPGGVLAVWSYGALHIGGEGVEPLVQEFYHDIVGPYWPPERRLVERGYRDLPFPFDEIDLGQFNMRVSWDRARLLGYLRTWSATGRYVEDKGIDPVEALERRLEPVWPDAQSLRTVSWPQALRVGRKPADAQT